MSRVYLLRHAKAAGAAPGMKDFDRPLTREGAEAARKMGSAMAAAGFIPDVAVCSTAKRTRETLDNLRLTLTTSFPGMDSAALYTAGASGYLEAIHAGGDARSLLVIGHNPSMEDLALALAAEGDPASVKRLSQGFPTAGLAVIDFDGPLASAEAGAGTLRAFITPDDL
ncbi:histidine phosphatase family protein [Phyllobacterium salinisoli]|uniref:Histidine phosphatase family protein n=1 Tax=Phyllobacterium salinisoli TaxID=1899321 RepID=A0A368K7S8_9HYPH|nr:histidine phosphatase family protein [Phyllobacterium salinisoli]RCS25264.1 histidine phosphatase family protein [Phyllobacterium salinisoli]